MDTTQSQIDLKNSILQKSTVLYVEDENILREEISALLKNFFKEVIIASNGEEALSLYHEHKNKIKIIITDINMPKMNGIEFISKVRSEDFEIPVLITTAFNDSEILMKAIRLNVSDYIIKPIQVITSLKICNRVLTNRNNELLVQKQIKELEDIKLVLEEDNFIIETNLDGEISYVNSLICKVSGYTKEELLGQKNSILKHPDTSKDFINSLWTTINSGEKWHGKIKNLTKDGNTFYVKTTIIPIFDENGKILKFLSTGILITAEEEEKQNLKRLILQQKGEKLKVEHEMQKKISEEVQKNLNNTSNQKDIQNQKLIALVNDMDVEIKRLRDKNIDYNSRVLTLENKTKETLTRFDNMQIGYQKKVSGMNNTIQLLAKKCEDMLKKNKIYSDKLEKSQSSINVLQGYIDDYRKKISDLEDVIAAYEKDIKDKKY